MLIIMTSFLIEENGDEENKISLQTDRHQSYGRLCYFVDDNDGCCTTG